MKTERRPGLFRPRSPAAAVLLAAAVLGAVQGCVPVPALTEDDFVVVSGPTSPRVATALRKAAGRLEVVVDVDGLADAAEGPAVELGLAAAKTTILTGTETRRVREGRAVRTVFSVPAADLVETPADWRRLRMGVAVRWPGGALGQDRLRERFLHTDARAPHAGLSRDPADWAACDPAEVATLVADRKQRIVLSLDQPMDGKATVVVEDAAGRRVRNLIAGVPLAKGVHTVEWDGLDEDGKLVPEGAYRWRSIHHPGLVPEYLLSFCNGDEKVLWPIASNHMHFVEAAANTAYAFFAAPMTEGGFAMIALDHQGNWKHGYNPILGSGMNQVAVAADEKFLYAAHDGEGWGAHIDKKKPDWKGTVALTLSRFNIEAARTVDFPGGQRFAKLEEHEFGPGAARAELRAGMSLSGMALLEGRLYIGSRATDALLVVDAATGKATGSIPLPSPGPLAARGGELFAVTGRRVVRVDIAGGKAGATVIPDGQAEPRGLAVAPDGTLYVSDGGTDTVKAFDAGGKPLKAFGKPGGPYEGAYDPARMVRPTGLAVAGGRLWVAEDRTNPKRALAWDLASGRVVVQKFGNPSYGGPGCGFDPTDPTRWIGMGALWKLDFQAGTAACTSILQKAGGHLGGLIPWCTHYKFLRQGGRTFLIGFGGVTIISELLPGGTVRDLAFLATTHRFCFACDWKPPQAFAEAFDRAFPDKKGKCSDQGPGVLWTDRSGDGLCQADELDFSTGVESVADAYWGSDQYDLTLRRFVYLKGKVPALIALEPKGFLPSGAPDYPSFGEAAAKAVPVRSAAGIHLGAESAVDRFGKIILNTDPQMTCFSADGKLRWTYPNRWSNVHGSHRAPLPEAGVMQGCLFPLGMATLDDRADVFLMNGNHGRFFALTSDGLYLDEMFKDCRLGGSRDAQWIGGECFGGFFGRAETDGEYYLQTGGNGYRVFRVRGLKEARRGAGVLRVSPAQLMAAERRLARKQADAAQAKDALVRLCPKPVAVDGADGEWAPELTVAWDRSGQFPVRAKCAYDAKDIHLYFDVRDASPWVNHGKDWTTLFKTGDSVDLQLGTDPAAPAERRGPVPGDIRLLLAPFEGTPVAVLYRHRVPGTKDPVAFTSPWRSETVDVVRRLDGAKVAVQKGPDGYRLEASIPLADLGLQPVPGRDYRADLGVIYGDPDGTVNVLRSYWANQATGLVNDVPGEIMLAPNLWGTIRFEGGQ